ncbi:MAG: recombinase family protein [Candidatus Hodarchaeales archaeon]
MKPFRVAIYTAGNASDINRQKKEIRNTLKIIFRDNNIWRELGQFNDFLTDNNQEIEMRKGLNSLLDQIKENRFDIVAVYRLDVFGWSIGKFSQLFDQLKELQVYLLSVIESDIFISQASLEGLKLPSLKRKAPYGYKYHKKENQLIPDSIPLPAKNYPLKKRAPAEIVEWVFKNYLKIKSFAQLTKQLNDQEIPSPQVSYSSYLDGNSSNKLWSRQQVKNILKNPIYKGEKKGQKIKSIVSQELWDQIQQLLPENQ